jgi:hypothetical protein
VDVCKKKDAHLTEEEDPQEVGEFFVWRCIKRDTKLRVAAHVDKHEEESVIGLLEKVKERTTKKEDPLFVSDGSTSIPPAMLAVWGQAVEEGRHRGPRWKKPRRQPGEGVLYARMIKQRDAQGNLVAIREEVTWGEESLVWRRIDPKGEGRHISTFCIERDNLTARLQNSRLARQTLRFSKQRRMLERSVALEDAYFNFCLPHDSLKSRIDPPRPTNGNGSPKKWAPCTPMMAEGLTFQVWTLEELLAFRVPPRQVWSKF